MQYFGDKTRNNPIPMKRITKITPRVLNQFIDAHNRNRRKPLDIRRIASPSKEIFIVFKISEDNGDGTYQAIRQRAIGLGEWENLSELEDTIQSVYEAVYDYIGMHGVGDYVIAKNDGTDSSGNIIYHIYDIGFVPGIFESPLTEYPDTEDICAES